MIVASATIPTPLPKQIESLVTRPFGFKSASDFRLVLGPSMRPYTGESQTYFVDDTGHWRGPREEVEMFLTQLCRSGVERWRPPNDYYPLEVPYHAVRILADVTGGTFEDVVPLPPPQEFPDGLQPIY